MDDRADAAEASEEQTTNAPADGAAPDPTADGGSPDLAGDPIPLGDEDAAAPSVVPVRVVGLTEEQRRRLVAAAPVELVEEGAELVVVSTGELADDPEQAIDPNVPTVLVVRPGDEALTVRLLAAGARGAVPEGEEGHALRAVGGSPGAELLAAWAAVAAGDGATGVLVDPDTGLPTALGLERVLGERDGRIVVAHAIGWRIGLLPERAGRLLRRRLAGELRAIAASCGGSAFVCDADTWGLWTATEDVDGVVEATLAAFAAHRPGGRPLAVAVADGRVRPGSLSAVVETLRRIVEEAATPGRVSASSSVGVSDLGFLAGLQEAAEEAIGLTPGHGERCADAVAFLLADDPNVAYATLVGRFHDIGAAGGTSGDDGAIERTAEIIALLGGGDPTRLTEGMREAIALAHAADVASPEDREELTARFPADLVAKLEARGQAVA